MTTDQAEVELDLLLHLGLTVDMGGYQAVVDERPEVCVSAVIRGLSSSSSEEVWSDTESGRGSECGRGNRELPGWGKGDGEGCGHGYGLSVYSIDGWGGGRAHGRGNEEGNGCGYGAGPGKGDGDGREDYGAW